MGCQQIEKTTKPKHRKGLWSPEEDNKLRNHILKYGHGCWSSVPIKAGLQRNGKSCRLRWINYLRPGLKRGMFSKQEEDTILTLHNMLGNKWSQIAQRLPGRTDNEIKNYWHSYLKKKMAKANQMVESNQQIQYATSSSDTGDNSSFSPEKLAIHHDPSYGLLNNMEKLLGAQYSDQSYEHNYNLSSKEACNQSSLPKLLFAEWLSLDQVNGGGPVNSNESLVLGNEFEQSSTFQETTLMMHMSEEGPFCEEYHNNNNMYHGSLTTQSSSIEDQNSELKFSNQVVGNEFIQHCISSGVDLCNNFSLNNNDAMYV